MVKIKERGLDIFWNSTAFLVVYWTLARKHLSNVTVIKAMEACYGFKTKRSEHSNLLGMLMFIYNHNI